jgi:flagellar biosynthesis component FlhA
MHPVVIGLLILPLIAVGILFIVRRSKALSPLVPALTLSGATGALITAFFAFTSTSVRLTPYELKQGAWLPVAGQVLLALYLGFGIGVIIAAMMGLPFQFFASHTQS